VGVIGMMIEAFRVGTTAFTFVIATGFDGCRTQDLVQLAAVWLFFGPFADGVVHVAVDFYAFITKGGVVEGPEDIAHYFVDGNTWVLPGIENAAVVW
jgi:hypothetical protein